MQYFSLNTLFTKRGVKELSPDVFKRNIIVRYGNFKSGFEFYTVDLVLTTLSNETYNDK